MALMRLKIFGIVYKYKWQYILSAACQLYFSELIAQPDMRILVETFSGLSFTKTEKIYNPGANFSLYTSTFKPSNFNGISVSIERSRINLGMNYRLQSIQSTTKKYYSWDTFTVIFKTKLFIFSPQAEYSIINSRHIISKIRLSYSFPARTGSILYKIRRTDNAGNLEILDNFYYQRTGAFYGGLNFLVRCNKDKCRAGITLGAEWLRKNGKSFGEWFQQHDRDRWYYMAGLSFTYTVGLKNKQGK